MTWQPTPTEVAEEDAFRRLYGEWEALDPAGTAAFMAGYPGEWWVVGGWAIEAFTGVAAPSRGHRPRHLAPRPAAAARARRRPAPHLERRRRGDPPGQRRLARAARRRPARCGCATTRPRRGSSTASCPRTATGSG